MAFGALAGGGIVAISGYAAALLTGAGAALVYLVAVAALVHEPQSRRDRPSGAIRLRTREVVMTARREAAASVAVKVVLLTGLAFGVSMSAVELLWQPRLAGLLHSGGASGVAFGALTAASMLAVALGAASSPRLSRRLGLTHAYVLAMVVAALFVALLGAPGSPLTFASVYLVAYLGFGAAEPMHYELLNDAVGPTARATLISAESLAAQGGALVANLSVGALAAAHGPSLAWAVAGGLLALTALAAGTALRRAARAEPTPAH
jgi:MFS family permease